MSLRPALCFLAPLSLSLVGVCVLFVLGAYGWPGRVGSAGTDFCEANRSATIAQPANTWSNLAFLVVGVAIGGSAWRDLSAPRSDAWNNRLVATVVYPASYATSVASIGLASAAMHASTTAWAAELDLLSMHVWGAWCIAFAATRLLRVGDPQFACLVGLLVVALIARIAMGHPLGISGATLFGAMIVAAIGIEVAGLWRNAGRFRIDTPKLAYAIGVFLAAYIANLVGKNGGAYCNPYSAWQGHAVWHVLCAGSAAFVYLYGRSERRRLTVGLDSR